MIPVCPDVGLPVSGPSPRPRLAPRLRWASVLAFATSGVGFPSVLSRIVKEVISEFPVCCPRLGETRTQASVHSHSYSRDGCPKDTRGLPALLPRIQTQSGAAPSSPVWKDVELWMSGRVLVTEDPTRHPRDPDWQESKVWQSNPPPPPLSGPLWGSERDGAKWNVQPRIH